MQLAFFFLPLPEPIGLPPEEPQVFEKTETLDEFFDRSPERLDEPQIVETVILKAHQIAWSAPVTGIDDSLIQLMRDALPWLYAPESKSKQESCAETDNQEESIFPVAVTVIEGAALLPEHASDWEAALSDAFDRVLSRVQQLQSAYYLARDRPVTHLTREILPSTVLYAIADIDEEGVPADAGEGGPGLFSTNLNSAALFPDENISDDELDKFRSHLDLVASDNPMANARDLDREALAAFHLRGDYRAAVIFVAAACEAKLDLALQFLLWEEGASPQTAASCFTGRKNSITARAKSFYSSRIGGNWSLDNKGPIRDWFFKVARVRNQIVHAMYRPSANEALEALSSGEALVSYISDLMASNKVSKPYPRTTISIVGKSALIRRGKWSQDLEKLAENKSEADWWAVFSNWSRWVDKERAVLSDEPWSPEGTRKLIPLAVILGNDALGWVLHDRYNKQAIRAKTKINQSSTEDLARLLREHTAALRSQGFTRPYSAGVPLDLEPMGEWVPEYDLVPEAQISVDLQVPTSWDATDSGA